MPTVEILPFAEGGGANVESQAAYAGSGHQTSGFSVGIADPTQANKVWRQSTFVAAALANAVSQILGVDVLDDANLAGLITKIINALAVAAYRFNLVPSSATPIFDCSAGAAITTFETVLTANTTATITGQLLGQVIILVIRQNSVGGWTFTPPSQVPMADISPAAFSFNTQAFVVAGGSGPGFLLYPLGPLTVFP